VELEVDIGVEEVVMPSVVVVREDDVDVGDWVVGAVVVEGVVGWTEVSGVDVIGWLSLLEVAIIADGVEEDIDEMLAEVRGADGLADDSVAVVATVVAAIVVCKTLRVIHAEESQKLNVNARRWLLRLFRKYRRCYKSRGSWSWWCGHRSK
jgi:hypothetical protein